MLLKKSNKTNPPEILINDFGGFFMISIKCRDKLSDYLFVSIICKAVTSLESIVPSSVISA